MAQQNKVVGGIIHAQKKGLGEEVQRECVQGEKERGVGVSSFLLYP
jgi:hypothetical protein